MILVGVSIILFYNGKIYLLVHSSVVGYFKYENNKKSIIKRNYFELILIDNFISNLIFREYKIL